MTTIWERVKSALTPLGLPLAANTYIVESGTSLPDTYIVYQMISSPPLQHADDGEVSRRRTMQVTFWSRAGLNSVPDIAGAMIVAGFTHGPDTEQPFSLQSRHYGLAMEFSYLEGG